MSKIVVNNNQNKALKALADSEKKLLNEFNEELLSEEILNKTIDDITNKLMANSKALATIDGTQYMLMCRVNDVPNQVTHKSVRMVLLVASDVNKAERLKGRYIPYNVTAKYDARFEVKANIRAAVEGFVRHITGTIKASMLD